MNFPKFGRNEVSKKGQLFKKVQDPHNGWKLKVKEQQKLSFAQMVTNGNGRNSFTNEGASWFNVKVESSSLLDKCFMGRLLEVPNMQLVKESFILGGFSVVRLRYIE